jgi:hypothetical protein
MRVGRRERYLPELVAGIPCHWCGVPMTARNGQPKDPTDATRDHVFPKSRGGKDRVWACLRCNTLKGNMDPMDWVDLIVGEPAPDAQEPVRNVQQTSDSLIMTAPDAPGSRSCDGTYGGTEEKR